MNVGLEYSNARMEIFSDDALGLQYIARVSDLFFGGVMLNCSKMICPNDQLLTNLAPCAFFRTQVGGSQFSLRSLEKIPSEMEVAPRNNC